MHSIITSIILGLICLVSNSTGLIEERHPPSLQISNNRLHNRSLFARADCKTTQVKSGDSCAALATRCGITGAQFTTYNSNSKLCSTLSSGQYVCCSSGTLPDLTPKNNGDGSCFSYRIVSGDSCYAIAASHSITADKIETHNKNTWGWTNCNGIQPNMKICLSSGTPPMPDPITGAICGPQVPDTKKPSSTDLKILAALNPCPLNACCDIWGNCGTTEEFCTATGPNKCISNCGMDIISSSPPSQFRSVGYFEGYTDKRSCLAASVAGANFRDYTHIHLAFAALTSDFKIDVSKIQKQFDEFVAMTGLSAKRIISIGGWSFSTDPGTYTVFRQAAKPANWATVSRNIADFLTLHNLDGVDLDWEYPGATDIPGVPAGDPKTEGPNYAGLANSLRNAIGSKSLSVALPASYWYLRNFEVKTMSKSVNYFVYMTYDLHGQWDYNNKFSDPGCAGGNCLRSHINLTETLGALTMITKAGVPSNQLAIGISSYGRSFQMVTPGCTGPMCSYTGPASGATPGPCTGTAGYIADAEIKGILANDSTAKTFLDQASGSNIMTYGGNQWVAYMDPANTQSRTKRYEGLAMGGISNWAMNLEDFDPDYPSRNPYLRGTVTGHDVVPNWKTIDCMNPAITDASQDQTYRWKAVHADTAWEDAVANWNAKPFPGGLSFIQQISNFFHGPENLACGNIGHNHCDLALTCGGASWPAGYFILNSLSVVDDTYNNMWTALTAAETHVLANMADFANAFAPITPESDIEKIILDIVGLGFALVAAPAWNIWFKTMPFFKNSQNELGALKDTINPIVSNSITIIKDSSIASQVANNNNALAKSMDTMVTAWAGVIATSNSNLFNGTDKNEIEMLGNLISDGKLMESGAVNPETFTPAISKLVGAAIFIYLIPQAWSLSDRDVHPFIVDSGAACGTSNPLSKYISEDDGKVSGICNPDDNKIYYLMSASEDADHCTQTPCGGFQTCTDNKFSVPPGISKLDGTNYGGIYPVDLILGALAGYHANNNQNGWSLADPSKSLDQLDQGIRSPGVVQIPVCDAETAFTNWLAHPTTHPSSKPADYPCTPVKESDKIRIRKEAIQRRERKLEDSKAAGSIQIRC